MLKKQMASDRPQSGHRVVDPFLYHKIIKYDDSIRNSCKEFLYNIDVIDTIYMLKIVQHRQLQFGYLKNLKTVYITISLSCADLNSFLKSLKNKIDLYINNITEPFDFSKINKLITYSYLSNSVTDFRGLKQLDVTSLKAVTVDPRVEYLRLSKTANTSLTNKDFLKELNSFD